MTSQIGYTGFRQDLFVGCFYHKGPALNFVSILVVTMTENCYTIHNPDEEWSYKIEWRGSDRFKVCKVGFFGSDGSDFDKEYKVCVEHQRFYLQSKGMRMMYMTGRSLIPNKVSDWYKKD